MDAESPEMFTVSADETKNFKNLDYINAQFLQEHFKDQPEILKEIGIE